MSRRRTLLRWGSGLTTAAACLLAAFVLQGGGDDSLAQRADALAASDESRQLSDILGFADELSFLTPAIDPHSVVEALVDLETFLRHSSVEVRHSVAAAKGNSRGHREVKMLKR